MDDSEIGMVINSRTDTRQRLEVTAGFEAMSFLSSKMRSKEDYGLLNENQHNQTWPTEMMTTLTAAMSGRRRLV